MKLKIFYGVVLALGLSSKAFALDPITLAYLVQGVGFALMQVQDQNDPKTRALMSQNLQLNVQLDHVLSQAYPDTSKPDREGLKMSLWNRALEQKKDDQDGYVKEYIKHLNHVAQERERLKKMSSLNKFQMAVESGRVCANLEPQQAESFLKIMDTVWNPWPKEVSDIWQQQCKRMLVTLRSSEQVPQISSKDSPGISSESGSK